MPSVVQPKNKKKPPAGRPPGRGARRSAPRPRPQPPTPAVRAAAAPTSWAELAGKAAPAEARRRERAAGFVEAVPTLRVAVLLALACAALTLYVGHLYASQALAEEVQELRREHHRLVLQQNRLRGEFDRMTAPGVILERAGALGLRPGGDYAATIVVTD